MPPPHYHHVCLIIYSTSPAFLPADHSSARLSTRSAATTCRGWRRIQTVQVSRMMKMCSARTHGPLPSSYYNAFLEENVPGTSSSVCSELKHVNVNVYEYFCSSWFSNNFKKIMCSDPQNSRNPYKNFTAGRKFLWKGFGSSFSILQFSLITTGCLWVVYIMCIEFLIIVK